MTTLLANVRWVRILLAGVATLVADGALVVLAVIVHTLLTLSNPGATDGGLVDNLTGQIGAWSVPVLAALAAAWVVRKAETRSAPLHGLLVGLLAAVGPALGLFGPPSLAISVLAVAGGLLGGLVGRRTEKPAQQTSLSCFRRPGA